jgi:hypothetical protein
MASLVDGRSTPCNQVDGGSKVVDAKLMQDKKDNVIK